METSQGHSCKKCSKDECYHVNKCLVVTNYRNGISTMFKKGWSRIKDLYSTAQISSLGMRLVMKRRV